MLISRKVNIWTEIEHAGAGLVETDDLAGTRRLLERWLVSSDSARQAMRMAAARTFHERYDVQRVARSLVDTIAPFVTASPALVHG